MSTIIKDKSQFAEVDCAFTFQGKTFTNNGAIIAQNINTGKYEGLVYANTETNEVTSWDGSIKIPARFSKPYRHNFGGHFQHVWFTYNGINFHGKYGCDWSQLVRVKQVK